MLDYLTTEMSTRPSLTEQTLYLTHQCNNTSQPDICQQFLESWWPDMATCLYQEWILTNLTCLYLGGCQHVSHPWLCADVSHLLSQVLTDSGSLSISQGAEGVLHGSCFCNSSEHMEDPTCNSTVSSLVPMVLPAVSDWLASRTDWLCTDTSNGADTCAECLGEVGG